MSKEAATRAMREARHAAQQASAAGAPARRAAAVAPPTAPGGTTSKRTPRKAPAGRAAPTETSEVTSSALCGHRSMNGRTCTREHGHAAKNHRYA